MNSHSKSVLITLLVLVSLGTGVGLVAANDFDMTIPGATDVPEQTEEGPDGNEYTVNAFAAVKPGDKIPVEVTVPNEDDDFRVELLNSDQQVEYLEVGTGSEGVTFEIDENLVGTHLFVLYVDGNREAIHPLVISGYEVATTDPKTADDENVEIKIDVDPTTLSEAPASVEVAVWDGNSVTRESTRDLQADGDSYRASVPLDSLSAGEYKMYAVAQGDKTVQGEPEVLGISDGTTFEVNEAPDNKENDGGSDGQQGGAPTGESDDDESEDGNETETDDSEDRNGEGERDDLEAEDDDENSSNEEVGDDDINGESVDGESGENTNSDVLAPTDSTSDETDDDVALHLLVTITAVIIVGFSAAKTGRAE